MAMESLFVRAEKVDLDFLCCLAHVSCTDEAQIPVCPLVGFYPKCTALPAGLPLARPRSGRVQNHCGGRVCQSRTGVAAGLIARAGLLVSGSEILLGCPHSTGRQLVGVRPAKRAGEQRATGLARAGKGVACSRQGGE